MAVSTATVGSVSVLPLPPPPLPVASSSDWGEEDGPSAAELMDVALVEAVEVFASARFLQLQAAATPDAGALIPVAGFPSTGSTLLAPGAPRYVASPPSA